MVNLNELAQEVHKANAKWWYDLETSERLDRNKGELLMLVVSEIAEAMEGERKNLMDDHLPHRRMAEVEMADTYIRLLDYAAGFNINIKTLNSGIPYSKNTGEQLIEIVDCVCDLWKVATGFDDVTFSEEQYLSYAFGLIFDYCREHGYDIEGAYHEKMAYNAVRADHQKEARLAANGKKW